VATVVNRCCAAVYALGVPPNYLVTLEVVGRRPGRLIRFQQVMAVVVGERYLVSMLGAEVNWGYEMRRQRVAMSFYVTDGARRCTMEMLPRAGVRPYSRPT
jgi:hypothetical protein